jgi:hypothetical protein
MAAHQAVHAPQLIHTDILANPDIAEVLDTWVLANAAELVDDVLQ